MADPAAKANNAGLSVSAKGLATLTQHEHLVPSYYNDPADNCTYGVGTLVHFGPCTAAELHTQVTSQQITTSLNSALDDAQRTIKNHVKNTQLTQDQFDALTSFVYNRGAGGSRHVLKLIDEGKLDEAGRDMQQIIYGTVKNKKTGKKVKQILPGLVTRRNYEAGPFRTTK